MRVRCNWCDEIFEEEEIIYDEVEDSEHCPYCGKAGCLMDLEE